MVRRRLHGRRGLKWAGRYGPAADSGSPPSRAAWIEMLTDGKKLTKIESPPSRAAWIEISTLPRRIVINSCRRLHGRRGLKFRFFALSILDISRRLHGRRGLKYPHHRSKTVPWWSPPSRAAWIEISPLPEKVSINTCRRLHGRRGLKCPYPEQTANYSKSPPSRAAWIEIFTYQIT